MKYIKYLAIFVLCFVAVCCLVPEFSEDPQMGFEFIAEMRLNSVGDRLLVRTGQYDYDFALPTMALSLALAPTYSNPIKISDVLWCAHGDLSYLQLSTDGSFRSLLTVTLTSYDLKHRGLVIKPPDKEIARLEQYGFTQFRNNYAGDFSATWSTGITGHRHDHNSLGAFSGADLRPCGNSHLKVILDTQEKMKRNHRFNAILRPFTFVGDTVKHAFRDLLLLIFLLSGGDLPIPRG